MKSLRLHGIGDLRLHDEPIPEPEYDEVLIRVKAVGICASDIHWVEEGTTGDDIITTPFVLGHEFGGVVVSGDIQGTRVAVDPTVPCDVCEFCLRGDPNLCPDHYFAGQAPRDGALREYMAWPMKVIIPIPDSISDDEAAVLEPLGVAIHTVDLGKVKPGMTIGVYGCGPIGLLTIQMARVAGASEILATDMNTTCTLFIREVKREFQRETPPTPSSSCARDLPEERLDGRPCMMNGSPPTMQSKGMYSPCHDYSKTSVKTRERRKAILMTLPNLCF